VLRIDRAVRKNFDGSTVELVAGALVPPGPDAPSVVDAVYVEGERDGPGHPERPEHYAITRRV